MITINDNREHHSKQFKDIREFDYFMCKDNLYMKLPDGISVDWQCKNAIRMNDTRTFLYFEFDHPVEPVDLFITINNPKE